MVVYGAGRRFGLKKLLYEESPKTNRIKKEMLEAFHAHSHTKVRNTIQRPIDMCGRERLIPPKFSIICLLSPHEQLARVRPRAQFSF